MVGSQTAGLLLLAAATATSLPTPARGADVIPTVADSQSQILRAGQMFSFRIVSSAPSKSSAAPGMPGAYAAYEVSAVILAVYKGSVLEKADQPFRATPFVYAGPIRGRPQGLWVGLTADDAPPHPGDIEVALCGKPSTETVSAAKALSGLGEGCELIPQSAIADVELVARLESTQATVAQAIEALAVAKSRDCYYFLEYLFARYDGELRQLKDWQPLLDLLSDQALPRNLRYTLTGDLDWIFTTLPGLPPAVRDAYLLALIRAALCYAEPSDQANLFSTRVKNWVHGEYKPWPKAKEVFQSAPEDRIKALKAIKKLPPSPDLKVVELWLE